MDNNGNDINRVPAPPEWKPGTPSSAGAPGGTPNDPSSGTPIGPVYEPRASYGKAARRPRRFWMIGLFLLIAGLLAAGAGYAMGGTGGAITFDRDGFHVDEPGSNDDVYIHEGDLPAFENVSVESSSANIEFIASDHYGIEMNLPKRYEVNWGVDNYKLFVERAEEEFSLQIMNFSLDLDEYYIKVYYPEGVNFDTVKLDTSSGNITADVFYTEKFSAHTSSGDIELDTYDAGFIKADATSGRIDINGDGDGRGTEADIHASSGDITIDGGNWFDLKVDSSSGSIEADAVFNGVTNIHASSGDVEINAGEQNDLGYKLHTSSGSIEVNGERRDDDWSYNTDGRDVIEVNVSSGSIDLEVDD